MMQKKKTNGSIIIKGARVHNLKNIDVNIPRNKFIVITGLSGSGKSSLAFDTIYAEGQRRYVESLSSYARQFLGRMNKPEADLIQGIPPAIAIEQKVNTRNPRSTVGTSTEVYDYLKLLFARIGKTFSPISGKQVQRDTVTDVVNRIIDYPERTKFIIAAPLILKKEIDEKTQLEEYLKEGFSRIEIDEKIHRIEDLIENIPSNINKKKPSIIIDRAAVQKDEDSISRYGDSAQTAFSFGNGICFLRIYTEQKTINEEFSNRFEADGIEFEEPNTNMFSFNNPLGACPKCEGYGKVIGIDEDLVIPNKNHSIYEDAIVCWKGEKMREWKDQLVYNADKFDFPIHKPYFELSAEQKRLLWTGNKYFKGLDRFFQYLEEKKYKIHFRVMLSRYRGKTTCPECNGSRLKKEAGYVKVHDISLQELVLWPVEELQNFFLKLQLSAHEKDVAQRVLFEINNRLDFLKNVGLGYLTLNRLSATLSGGESQRINLATSLGSSLVGSLYILDEPSIGLHPRDTNQLIYVLRKLQKLGNTVLVVEHEEEIIRAADELIDIGPEAGRFGGEVVFQGTHKELEKNERSLTAKYLTGIEQIPVPELRRKWNNYIEVFGARENNLQNINVKFPLNILTVVTGVSGSGKSSLVRSILFPALTKILNGYGDKTGQHDSVNGDFKLINNVEIVDQNPIGKSSRSNPATYLKAYDEIRKLYAEQIHSKHNGFKSSHFSFNIAGGRCEECQGDGTIKVEMQFMADVYLQCESCHGKRFKEEILEVKYKGKNIHDVLEMSVNEALEFFAQEKITLTKKICNKLQPLQNVGLGYVKLGQASSTLSGGESQRIKLASFLSKDNKTDNQLFIFDEPTTGLHFHDIRKLLDAFNALIEKGHSIIIIEHNSEVIKSADWVIDLGPEGGNKGGQLIFEGTPEELSKCPESYTGKYLIDKL